MFTKFLYANCFAKTESLLFTFSYFASIIGLASIVDVLTFFKPIFAILQYFIDDSGRWGSGGLFTALSRRSALPKEQYELAGKMKGRVPYSAKRDHFDYMIR